MKTLCQSCKLISLENNHLVCSISPRSKSPGYSSVAVGALCVHDTDNMMDRFEPASEPLNESLLKKIEEFEMKLMQAEDKHESLLDKLR